MLKPVLIEFRLLQETKISIEILPAGAVGSDKPPGVNVASNAGIVLESRDAASECA